ncbi:diguanylate cyclase [Novispirillum itersonii]|uniref:GGDEF domain-containing protein n=1 Tax=Novispirillum itersonii TaxID=189 RepID=A0A7W9ZHR2_NOVIT|nr:diguanylate cyclase [Novispirillum itersonii]MBB6211690.1 GGDEF domain-containing protein [Novispirillum itersonii]
MSDIEEPSAPVPVGWRNYSPHGAAGEYPGSRPDQHRGPPDRRRRAPYGGGTGHPASIADAVELFGVETRDLGPQLRDLLVRVAGEVETLKEELERAEQRVQFLDQQAHRDPRLPVLHAQAFHHHLDGVLRARAVTDVAATAVLFYLDNHDDLRRRFGLRAADACLEVLLREVQGSVRGTDLIGAIGPAGLAVLFYPADADGVRRKVQGVVNTLARTTLPQGQTALPLKVVAGIWDLAANDTADGVLEELDQQVRRPWR